MDIKDIILIGGGLLIAAVIAHGFWIAWRARRDPLRIDLVKDFPADDDGDDLRHLRGELPNGGARLVGPDQPHQESLGLEEDQAADAPMLLEASDSEARAGVRAERRTEPHLGVSPAPRSASSPRRQAEPHAAQPEVASATRAGRSRVADVVLPERGGRTDEPREPRRWSARKAGAGAQAAAPRAERPAAGGGAERREAQEGRARTTERPARGGVQAGEPRPQEPRVEELIMINVLAPKGAPFTGGGLVETLRARGLRYGEMNIFHRVDPMTRATLYSVANVVEPGTFDLADLDSFRSPGVCFFMKLPGPEQPLDVFEDLLKVARDVAVRMGGELKDEQRSVMTGQTVEHYRQRISDFCRRRMSMRA